MFSLSGGHGAERPGISPVISVASQRAIRRVGVFSRLRRNIHRALNRLGFDADMRVIADTIGFWPARRLSCGTVAPRGIDERLQ